MSNIVFVDESPFMLGAEKIFDRLLLNSGVCIDEVDVLFIHPTRLKRGGFKPLLNTPPLEEMVTNVKERIKKINPNVVVPLGGHTLSLLAGKWGEMNWRGSILWDEELGCKIVPTLRPESIMRQFDNVPLVQFDISKIKEESKTHTFNYKKKTLIVGPTFEVVMHELQRMHGVKKVAFDLETTRCTGEGESDNVIITAIGFSDNKDWAICIPLTKGEEESYWQPEEELAIMQAVKELMEDESVEKIAHNAQFDCGVFEGVYGIKTIPLKRDTMCGFHVIYPELPKSLSVVCSIYTNVPYYDDWSGKGDYWFWMYNAMDSCVCFEIDGVEEEEMEEFGVTNFYNNNINPLIPVLLSLQMRGVKIDKEFRDKAKVEVTAELKENEKKFTEVVGYEVNVNSSKQLAALLYDDMNLPAKHKTNAKGKRVVTTNEQALLELAKAHPSPIFDFILHIRGCRKTLSTYLNMPTSEGRAHTSYNIGGRLTDERGTKIVSGPETGRLSSSRSIIFNSGTNLQNIPHGMVRKMFIPDDGKIMVSADLAQAEARIVAYLADEREMIACFERGEDIHNLTKSMLPPGFVPPHEYDVDDPLRYFAKRHTHAFDYLESANGLAKESGLPLAQAREIRDSYFRRFPMIALWQKDIEKGLRNDRVMVTPMGRKRMFFGRYGDQLFKEACAYVPQSTVGDILNIALVRMDNLLRESRLDAQLLLQIHDSFILQCLESDMPAIKEMLPIAFDIPVTIGRYTFTIPYDIEIGPNWGELEKVKK